MPNVMLERTINAPVDKVWEIAGVFMRSPGPSVSVIPGKEGDPARNGVGSERTIKFRKTPVQERLESIDPPKSFSFSIIGGAPVKSLLVNAEFIPIGETTKIKWSGIFTPKSIFLCWITAAVIKRNFNQYSDALAESMH